MARENWQLPVFPILGIVLTGIFVRYVVKLDITKGTNKMLKQLKAHNYIIRARVMVSPMIGAILTLGFGVDFHYAIGAALVSSIATSSGSAT